MSAPLDLASILHAAHAAADTVEAKLDEIGLSWPKLMALQILSQAGESLPLGQLAERLSCVKSNITQLVDRLEADGLVARLPDPRDRRTKLAALTAAGRKAVKDGSRVQQAAEHGVLGRLSKDEARQLGALLTKMSSSS